MDENSPPPRPSVPKREREPVVVEGEGKLRVRWGLYLVFSCLTGALGAGFVLGAVWYIAGWPNFKVHDAPVQQFAKMEDVEQRFKDVAKRLAELDQRLSVRQEQVERRLDASVPAGGMGDVAKRLAEVDQRLSVRQEQVERRLDALAASVPAGEKGALARAVAVIALVRDLWRYRPISSDLEALDHLGVSAQDLAPLRPYAAGVPPLEDLLKDLKKMNNTEESVLGGLIKIRKHTDVFASVVAALHEGDLLAAQKAFAALPTSAQETGRAFGESLKQRVAARLAASALFEKAVADLGVGQ